jgi:glycosyltransferase involved in cell wall biosynthesis
VRIAVWHNLPSGGGKRALYDQITGLLDRGHQIESWCPPTADQTFLPLGRIVPEHIVELGATGTSLLSRGVDLLTKGATNTLSELRELGLHTEKCAALINTSGVDVLLAASSAKFAVSAIARTVTVPTVLYLGEPHRRLYEYPTPWPALTSSRPLPLQFVRRVRDSSNVRAERIVAREELLGATAFDRILVNSYFSHESVLRAYGLESHVCYLGIDTERYFDKQTTREHMVVGIGQFDSHKRVEMAIRAVASMTGQLPELWWIGNSGNRQYIRDLESLALRSNVDFRPIVAASHEELVDVLNRAKVMIYAPRLEPFGYAPLEGGACGLPVVATAEGGVRETVIHGETGLLVDEGAALAPALSRLMDDEALRDKMRGAARLNVETHWTLGSATDRLESHLRAVVDDSHRASVEKRMN